MGLAIFYSSRFHENQRKLIYYHVSSVHQAEYPKEKSIGIKETWLILKWLIRSHEHLAVKSKSVDS